MCTSLYRFQHVISRIVPVLCMGIITAYYANGAHGGAVTSQKVVGSIPDKAIGYFRPHYGPEFELASNRNGCQVQAAGE
jgi:hypothetical protein